VVQAEGATTGGAATTAAEASSGVQAEAAISEKGGTGAAGAAAAEEPKAEGKPKTARKARGPSMHSKKCEKADLVELQANAKNEHDKMIANMKRDLARRAKFNEGVWGEFPVDTARKQGH